MNEINPNKLMPKPGLFMRAMIIIAGVDEDTLRECPQHDWDCVRASALLFVAVWVYQTAVFSIVGQYLLAHDGRIHIAIVAGAAFIATFILLLDSYVFNRASYYRDGIRELKRGGLDLGDGIVAGLKAFAFLALRIFVLSLPIAQLTAIFFGIIVFHADVISDQETRFQQQNAALIAKAREHVDGEIADAAKVADESAAEVQVLQRQVSAMRNGTVDAASGDPAFAAGEEELRQLMQEKARRDVELEAAQKFASAELAGQKVEAVSSGRPGRGPVRIAAEERVKTATSNVREVDSGIANARKRLDGLRGQLAAGAGGRSQRSREMLPDLERDLAAETKNLSASRQRLAELTNGRDGEIREEVENAPNCVKESVGFIGQLRSLRRIAEDPEIAAVIILIDITSFGLELAAVLAKVTTYVPMEYTARLARNAYLRVVRLAREIDGELNGYSSEAYDEAEELPPVLSPETADAEHADSDEMPAGPIIFERPVASNGAGMNGATQVKRGRGRPRKYPPPVIV